MKILNSKLKGKLPIRTQKNFPIKGIEFIDITPLIMDKKSFRKIHHAFVQELKGKKIDYIVVPEARGFLFGASIAQELNIGLVPVRKKGKLPPNFVAKTFSYEKEYGKDELELPTLGKDSYKGKNFYILDDIYATGNTMNAIRNAIITLKGNVIGIGAILNIPALNQEKNLFSLIDIEEETE